jgi:hypothetical protein
VPERAALWHFPDPAGRLTDNSLAILWTELHRWPGDLAAPVCVVDGFGVGARGVTVLAAGRDRPWDLDRKEKILTDWAGEVGLGMGDRMRVPFRQVQSLGQHPGLPAWARHSSDWTFLARCPGQADWPTGLAKGRVVWQGAPQLLWVPLAHCEPGKGWKADTLYRGGALTGLPPPAASVPLKLLIGLKDLFDPSGWLGEPGWLEEARRDAG